MTRSRGINAPKAVWSDDQVATLRQFYANFKTDDIAFMLGHSRQSVYRKAGELGLKKTPEFVAQEAARSMARPDHPARQHRFTRGQAVWNKGVKGVAGVQEACRGTQFKAGQQPHNTLPIGSLKLDKDGTLQRKISNDKGNNSARWRAVHELVWVEANGPLPANHIVVFKPGMRTNVLEEIKVDRVECISLAENMKRNTRHNLPPELNQVVQLRAVLTRHINKRMKNGQKEHR